MAPGTLAYAADRARRTARGALPALALVFAVVGAVYLVAPPIRPGTPFVVSSWIVAAGIAALTACLPRVADRHVHLVCLLGGLAAAAEGFTFLAVTHDPEQTVTLIVVLMGASYFLLSAATHTALVVLTLVGWSIVATSFPGPAVVHWGVNLVSAAGVAVVINASRLRALRQEADTLRALSESDERHRLVVASALDAVVTTDMWGRVVDWNAEAEALFGWTADEVRGRGVQEILILPEHRPPFRRRLAALRDRGEPFPRRRIESELLHRHGTRIPVEITNVSNRRGDEVSVTSWIRDLRDRRRAEEAMRAATQAKSDFLATISHEIRTPIHGILGMTEIALDTGDAAERDDVLHRARTCAETLLAIVNDVLDFAKIDAGKLVLDRRPTSLREIVDGVLDTVAVEAERKDVVLVGSVAPALPDTVVTDPTRLRQVLLNLVSNAVKFTDRGEVELRLEPAPDDDERLRGVVRDTGIGIPPEKLHAVFEAFTQADQATTTRYGGTGLGLAIARRLVALMDGALDLDSTPGVGSTFSFTVGVAAAPRAGAAEPPLASGTGVLVVDGNATRGARLAELLAAWGVRVALAADAATASAQLARARPAWCSPTSPSPASRGWWATCRWSGWCRSGGAGCGRSTTRRSPTSSRAR
jgi:PAS domain S-box-containing protein